ncbi:hypothetical protein FW778_17325 [Ginsengibacter hankyongi]|uniref:GLPGLI family protein n=1 Tax=Ginsengibacter hankyongi TaxID=2607284 RepID=A0A5J5ID71_9BACT|nr:hypothetical protein [Ginsengibacter hankyongi]KAA9037189.1 hypothetical protein FW778_17325 [Ginsengibacter hankyongi]
MNKLYFLLILSFFLSPAFAQNIVQVTIDNRGKQDIITFLVDESVVVNMTKYGKIIDWGKEYTTPLTGIYPRLEKYMGREEYYSSTDNEAYRGKVKYIGRTSLTYYTADDKESLKGKLKTIGTMFLDYYTDYDDVAFRGFLRNAGSVPITYYSSFNDEFYKGKIKSIGSTMLSYYGAIDDKAYRGKIKSIDRNMFTYYSSFDRQEFSGIMKTGSPIISGGSIKYIIKNY